MERSPFETTNADAQHELRASDMQVVQALIDVQYPYDCDVIPINDNTWAIHGPIPVEGEMILAEFSTKEEAELALQLLAAAQQRTGESHGGDPERDPSR
jgi:hypothetical protein